MKPLFLLTLMAATVLSISAPVAAQTPTVRDAASMDPNAIRVLLSPQLETTLASQMAGRILTLNGSLGASVTKGSTLVALDCSEPNARLQMAQAEHAMAQETLDTKRRLRELEAAGDMEVTLAQATLARAKAANTVARAQIAQCTVTAPFSGRLVKLHVKPFQGVTPGMPLLEMVSDGPLKVRLNVPSRMVKNLRVGTPFDVDVDETGKTYAAKVTAINARVDAVAQTLELEARIQGKPTGLLAGMTGTARFKSAP